MNVSLTPELERLVASKVDSGEYNSTSEVVRHALPLLSREDQEHQAKLVALRSEIGVGMAEIEGGEAISGPIAVEHARAEFRRLTGRAP